MVLYFTIVAVLGLFAMYALASKLGEARTFELPGDDDVRALIALEYPGHRPDEVALSRDGHGALVTMAGSPAIGLVQSLGTHPTTRLLEPGGVRSARAVGGGELALRLADFTFPRASLQLADADQARRWLERLRALEPEEAGAPA